MNNLPIIVAVLAIVAGLIVFLILNKKRKTNMDQPATPSQSTQSANNVNALDEMIKSKFKLFQGLRTEEEDQKTLDRVQDMCFEEMLYYISEKLTDEQKKSFEAELDASPDEDSKIKVFSNYLQQIPGYQTELNERLNKLLDKVYETSLNTSK